MFTVGLQRDGCGQEAIRFLRQAHDRLPDARLHHLRRHAAGGGGGGGGCAVGVRIRAVKAILLSDVVLRAPPVVRDWLFAILARGETASGPRKVTRPAIKKGILRPR